MNQKGFTKIVLVIVILTIVVIGGYVIFSKKLATEQQPFTQTQQIPSSESQPSQDTTLNIVASTIEQKLPLWINLWQGIISEFNVATFKEVNEKSIVPDMESAYDVSQQDKLYELIYVYSPDKTKFVNPRLGMELYNEDGKIKAALGVDSGVTLVDLKNKQWKRLLFCGTPCSFDDAVWIDNNIFAVVGHSEYYPETGEERCTVNTKCTRVATLHVFNLSKNIVTLYYGPETEKVLSGYLRARFPSITFD